MLPDGDGVELLARRRAAGDRLPAIVLTAREDDALRARATAAGADAFVGKPFNYNDLLAQIRDLLKRPAAGAGT